MAKSKALPPDVLADDADSLFILFYISNSVPRVSVRFPTREFDRPLSAFTTLTPAQKLTLRALLLAIRDETFTLEGYT